MSTGLIYDAHFLEHETGPGHPERPDRLRAVVERLRAAHLWEQLSHLSFGTADRGWIERLHEPEYIDRCFAVCAARQRYIDTPDSAICGASAEIAQLAAGGVLAAVDAVMAGRVRNAFCAVRPPGHHAEADRSMGFCLFNNVAVAAEYLISHHGLDRVAVIDWDVHHGNGTQHLFERRRDVLFISLHEHPSYLYPGTGFASETGVGAGEGYTLNIPLDPGSGDEVFRAAITLKVAPLLERFGAQFILISAGFDASRNDPLAHLEVSGDGFAWMTRHIMAESQRYCGGRLVSVLEGGYNLRRLGEDVALHVTALLGDAAPQA